MTRVTTMALAAAAMSLSTGSVAHAETVASYLVERGRPARFLGARRVGVDSDPALASSARGARSGPSQ